MLFSPKILGLNTKIFELFPGSPGLIFVPCVLFLCVIAKKKKKKNNMLVV